jgi:D-beta-D-heptose 7-phosphate kinase / D-beta-D-heptose 1-phosphate adenosyltransferase
MQHPEMFDLLNRFHKARILVLGDVMLDRFVYGTVERISPEAPIPVLSIESRVNMPGGAANVARNIAAMGAHVTLLGVVGNDLPAEDLRAQLVCSPTIDARLVSDSSRPTSVKTRYVANGQQLMRADQETRLPISDDVQRSLLQDFTTVLGDSDVVVLSDYAKGVLSNVVARTAIDSARRTGKTVIVDPKSDDFGKYAGADVITPNRRELQVACGRDCTSQESLVISARHLLDQGICGTLVVTLSKDGILVINRAGSAIHLSTAARQVFDVSGAGDTVVAVMALGLASGGQISQAAQLANIAAGIVVGKQGTAAVTPGEMMAHFVPYAGHADPQKLFSLENILPMVQGWRLQGQQIAFTNGCFDLLHPGHISLLDQARCCADRLIVGLNADSSIRRLKGAGRPVQSEVARATVLGALKSVDAVVIFSEDTPIQLIEALEPDVLVKGADYTVDLVVGADLVLGRGGRVVIAQLLPGHSTTETVKRVSCA